MIILYKNINCKRNIQKFYCNYDFYLLIQFFFMSGNYEIEYSESQMVSLEVFRKEIEKNNIYYYAVFI